MPTISKCFQMMAKVDKNCKIRTNFTKVDKCWQKLTNLETSAVYVMYQMHFLLKSHKDANILFNRTACQEIKLNIFQHFNCSSCEGSSPKRPSKVKAVGQLALGVSQTWRSKQGFLVSTQMQSSNNYIMRIVGFTHCLQHGLV